MSQNGGGGEFQAIQLAAEVQCYCVNNEMEAPFQKDLDGVLSLMSHSAIDESEDSFAHRRARYKAKPMDYQQKRREEALEQQKNARLDRTVLARKLAAIRPLAESKGANGGNENATAEALAKQQGFSTPSTGGKSKKWKQYAGQLQIPEPLVEIPPDFLDNWLCVPNPVGMATGILPPFLSLSYYYRFIRSEVSRNRLSGYNICNPHRRICLLCVCCSVALRDLISCLVSFNSLLPGGSESTGTKADQFCILDCVYSEAQMTFHILDVLCWNARVFYDLESAGRQIWAKSRVVEDGPYGPQCL